MALKSVASRTEEGGKGGGGGRQGGKDRTQGVAGITYLLVPAPVTRLKGSRLLSAQARKKGLTLVL